MNKKKYLKEDIGIDVDRTDKTFKPTASWMSEKYDEINSKLFNNMLGDCSFSIFTKGSGSEGRTLGFFELQERVLVDRYTRQMFVSNYGVRTKINENNFVELCRPKISLNGNYSGTEYAFLNTLVHEMCHYYTYKRGYCPTQAHGREFNNIGEYISNKSGGFFTIQRLASAEEMEGYVLSDEMVQKQLKREERKKTSIMAIFEFCTNGEIRLTTTSNESLISYRCAIIGRNDVDKVITSRDINLINFLFDQGYRKNFRTFRYWNVTNEDWLDILNKVEINVIENPTSSIKENILGRNTDEIITEVMNRYIESKMMDDVISITPDMNLGLASPFEE